MSRERLRDIARAAAKLVDTFYEFEGDTEEDRELMLECIQEPLDHLASLLVEAGYRPPPPPPPTPEELDRWIKARVSDAYDRRV